MPAIIGTSPALAAIRSQVERLLGQSAPGRRMPLLLIQGESGVGKGLLAREIHRASARHQGPFVEINCAAIPESLVEAELFGVERGAYTDARNPRPGIFQTADGGVLFLDEVGTLPLPVQAKLLSAVEQRQVRRVGSTRPENVDAWIISASNDDLQLAAEQNRFRRDLYHRLAGVTLRVPPLRERGRDVLDLAQHYLATACAEYGRPSMRLTPAAQAALRVYSWPGNVRQLANLMERVALLTDEADVGPELLGFQTTPVPGQETRPVSSERPGAEREELLAALEASDWSLSRAAARLQMPRSTLRYRMEKHGLFRSEQKVSAPQRQAWAAPGEPKPVGPMPVAAAPGVAAPPSALRWERHWVTALHAALLPEDGVASFHLAPILENLVEKLQGFGAHLEGIHPRGFLALFGLEPVEDAPSRAVHAAWAMQKSVERVRPDVGVTCALHTRECLIARGGTVVGVDPADKRVLLASLENLARRAVPPSVLATADTARFLDRRFDLVPLEATGGDAPPEGYRVVGRGRSGFGVGNLTSSPFLGRDRELAVLDDLLAQTEQSRGQAVGLSGEPGVGKSRLLYEFRHGLEPGRISYVEGRCVSYGHTIPYLPILDIVRQWFLLAEVDTPEVVSQKAETGLRALGLDAAALLPYLLNLLGIKAETEGPLSMHNPETVKVRTIDMLRQLSVACGRERVTVIGIEDMHWIDHASEEVLAALVESAGGCRMLLLCTYRPGYHPPWLTKSYATQLRLGRLSRPDSVAIVNALAANKALSSELSDMIVQRADGNPFFLEELARVTYEQPELGDAFVVPETIQDVLTARIDRLPRTETHVLDAAAVLGKDFVVPLLSALVRLPEAEFSQALAHLQASEFVVETGIGPTPTCTFKHGLTQEVAYRNIPAERRQALHADAAAVIERLAPDVSDRTPEVLARHYTQAGLLDQALNYWHRAGTRAIAKSANVEAMSHLREGLALLETSAAGPERSQLELLFLLTLATPTIMVQGYEAAEAAMIFERARVICANAGGSPQLFPALFGLWRYYFVRANYEEAERLTVQVRAMADAAGVPALMVAASLAAGLTSFYVGRLMDAQGPLEAALHQYDPRDSDSYVQLLGEDPKIATLTHLTWARYIQGSGDAVTTARETLAQSRAGGHPFAVAYSCHFLAVTHEFRREHELACQAAAEETAVALENTFHFFVAQGQMIHGASLAHCGRVDEGLDLLLKGLDAYRRGGAGVGLTYNLGLLASAYRRKGLAAEAIGAVDEGLAFAQRTGERFWESELWRLKGELLAEPRTAASPDVRPATPDASGSRPVSDDAERCLEDAYRHARGQGAWRLEIRAAMSLAGVLVRRERRHEAERVLEESLARAPEGGSAADELTDARAALEVLRTTQL